METPITPEPLKPELTHGVCNTDGTTRLMQQGDCEMARMGPEGDVKSIWDRGNPDEVANAERTFNDLTKKGYKAFKVSKDGSQGEQLDKFDAAIERMVLIPALQGG